ncbi:MAG: hypothetical protein GXW89_05985 [Phycisphaerae bacterium]|nr:hypothetical protein [Phycisphaerae bacterium]
MTARQVILPALAIVFLGFFHTVQAQQASTAPAGNQPAEQRQVNVPAPLEPVNISQEDLARLRASLPRLRAKLKTDFENSKEWKAAIAAVKQTTKDYESVRKATLAKVRATPEYAKAVARLQKAQQEYDALPAQPADAKAAERLMKEILAARSEVGKLEAEELKKNAEVSAAKEASVKAQQELAALRKRFEESYTSAPEWTNRLQQIETIESALLSERLRQEQELTRQQQENSCQQRREQEERAFRQEVLAHMTVQRMMLEQQYVALTQPQTLGENGRTAEPIYVGPYRGVCLPRPAQRYGCAPRRVRPRATSMGDSVREIVITTGD